MQQEEYSKFESFTKEGEFAKGLDLNQGTQRERGRERKMTRIESVCVHCGVRTCMHCCHCSWWRALLCSDHV